MTIAEFTERTKTAKIKDLELIFRTPEKVSLEVVGMFYGVKTSDGSVTHPQVGTEPDCVILQVAPIEA